MLLMDAIPVLLSIFQLYCTVKTVDKQSSFCWFFLHVSNWSWSWVCL